MATFFRIHNNTLFPIKDQEVLGFDIKEPSYIPSEYLNQCEFLVLRTCFGLGDWGIISAMPRLLKQKYPNCKVYLPSDQLMDSIFGSDYKKQWGSWANPYDNMRHVFDNNPYVDGEIDTYNGEVYHDHFRLAKIDEEPLVKQMLRFWQFNENELTDLCPELYFSDEEKKFGNSIIDEYTNGKYGTLLISDRFKDNPDWVQKLQHQIDVIDLPMFYWLHSPDVPFNFKKILDLRHIHPRIQLYLKCQATSNVGLQCGVNDTVARYADTYSLVRGKLGTNVVECEYYIL